MVIKEKLVQMFIVEGLFRWKTVFWCFLDLRLTKCYFNCDAYVQVSFTEYHYELDFLHAEYENVHTTKNTVSLEKSKECQYSENRWWYEKTNMIFELSAPKNIEGH